MFKRWTRSIIIAVASVLIVAPLMALTPQQRIALMSGAANAVSGVFNTPIVIITAGTTTNTASGALNNTTTGNITVGATAGWPSTGTLKTSGGNVTEFMSFAVVDATTLNITVRGTYGSIAATHAGVVTVAYAQSIQASSTSAIPNNSVWSDGTMQISLGTSNPTAIFTGTHHNTGLSFVGFSPQIYNNGTVLGQFLASADTFFAPIQFPSYTVSGLPTGVQYARVFVTDQLTSCPAIGAALTGGGSVVCPAYYNGAAWVGG